MLIRPLEENLVWQSQTSELLRRLPAKTVTRCRCVCRWFSSVINHPRFAADYNASAVTIPNRSHFFLQIKRRPDQDPSNGLCPFVDQGGPGEAFPGRSFSVVANSFGVLCLASSSSPQDVCLWNPSTRTHRHLNMPKYPHQGEDEAADVTVLFGLGSNADSVSMLLRSVQSYSYEKNEEINETSVCDLNTEAWKTIGFHRSVMPSGSPWKRRVGRLTFGHPGVHDNHKIIWIDSFEKKIPDGDAVLTFRSCDLNSYVISSETQVIPAALTLPPVHASLHPLEDGRLGLLCHYHGEGESERIVSVLVKGTEDAWTLIYTLCGPYENVKLLSLSPSRFLLHVDSRLRWYNHVDQLGGSTTAEEIHPGDDLWDAVKYVENPCLTNGARTC